MCTHPTFYFGRLRPYYQYEPVLRGEEHLRGQGPRPPSIGPVSTFQSGRLAKRPAHAVQRGRDELQSARHEENESNVRSQVTQKQTRRDCSNDPDPNLEPDQVFPPPPHPLDYSGGDQRFLVERILNHRDVNGVRKNCLVRWCGYPPTWDSWEPRAQLIVGVSGLVEQYDATHTLRSKKGYRKTTSPNVSTGFARCQSLRPSK
uniref:Chromo domain-containing protein n=1 Tax=Peronospora matthiolae TaxID=2874970 RepID=A0AAV1V1P7_9STRA